jgi:hypothetical protein
MSASFASSTPSKASKSTTLVLQRHAHRADTPHIFGLPMCQFIDEEVKQHLPCLASVLPTPEHHGSATG